MIAEHSDACGIAYATDCAACRAAQRGEAPAAPRRQRRAADDLRRLRRLVRRHPDACQRLLMRLLGDPIADLVLAALAAREAPRA